MRAGSLNHHDHERRHRFPLTLSISLLSRRFLTTPASLGASPGLDAVLNERPVGRTTEPTSP